MRQYFLPFLIGILITSLVWVIMIFYYLGSNNKINADKILPVSLETLLQKPEQNFERIAVISNKLTQGWKEKLNLEQRSNSNSVVKGIVAAKGKENLEDDLERLGLVQSASDKYVRQDGYKNHAFNTLISQRLSMHREIPDTRNKLCKTLEYPSDLPKASIVICFYNEDKNTLFRTVHSVLDRTPDHLIEEIILVDDSSDMAGLHESIRDYLNKNFPAKVSLTRTRRREGLIRARIFGAHQAKGKVLLFLDSHCEVNVDWLQPMLARIAENRTVVVTPIIDIINADTFLYTASPLVRGGFNWGLHFKWDSLPEGFLKTPEDFVKPIPSPTMAGGLFAMERDYFLDLGEYDAGMNIWGGENLEMSFRVWQCGGRLEIIPCSRVGHIFRRRRPYGSPTGEDTMTYNSLRMAHVWMDNYTEYYFQTRPEARNMKYGDVSSRLRLRQQLKCKDFHWFLQNVYPEQTLPNAEAGDVVVKTANKDRIKKKLEAMHIKNSNDRWRPKIRSRNYVQSFQMRLSGTRLCAQSKDSVTSKGSTLVLGKCSETKKQQWWKSGKGELVLAQLLCLEAGEEGSEEASQPRLSKCHEMGGHQQWSNDGHKSVPIYNVAAGLCLGVKELEIDAPVFAVLCGEDNFNQWDLVDRKNLPAT